VRAVKQLTNHTRERTGLVVFQETVLIVVRQLLDAVSDKGSRFWQLDKAADYHQTPVAFLDVQTFIDMSIAVPELDERCDSPPDQ
jgi:hypothetical protein